jgi:hypothetical protein
MSYGEIFNTDAPPMDSDLDPVEDDSVCLNGNSCDIPNCPEHGEDQAAIDAAESEGFYIPNEEDL